MWRVFWSTLLFLMLTFGRSAPGFAADRKEVHVSIRPHSIPPDVQKWAFRRHTKTRILDVEQGFDRATEGLTVFVYDPKAPPENNCVLKEAMDERGETEREDIHLPPEWRERCSGGGGGSPKGAGESAARTLAQVGAVANLSSPEGEKGGSPYGVAGGMNPNAASSPGLQAAVASVQIALSAGEMKQIVERATRFIAARLTTKAEIEAVEKAALSGIEQLAKEGRAVSREAIEEAAREAARKAERSLPASGAGKAVGSKGANGLTTVHVPGPRKPPPLGASGTPIRTGSASPKAPEAVESTQGPRLFRGGKRSNGLERSRDVEGVPRCEYCGTEITPQKGRPNSYEADHRVPYSRGGATTDENLAPACRTCNRSKGAKPVEEWKGQ